MDRERLVFCCSEILEAMLADAGSIKEFMVLGGKVSMPLVQDRPEEEEEEENEEEKRRRRRKKGEKKERRRKRKRKMRNGAKLADHSLESGRDPLGSVSVF